METNTKHHYNDLTRITLSQKIKDLLFSLPLNKLYLPYLSPYIHAFAHTYNTYTNVNVLKQPEGSKQLLQKRN